MKPFLVVGCPAYRRSWILPQWFDHIEAACLRIDVEPIYCFVVDSQNDHETLATIHDQILQRCRLYDVSDVPEPIHDGARTWPPARLEHMAWLRNRLLGMVRFHAPTLFWSVDSDILVHPESLGLAIEQICAGYDAVASRAYMGEPPHTTEPNWCRITREGGIHRQDVDNAVFEVPVIMALKLMTPKAYNVDYGYSHHGEDIAWSDNARAAGCRLGWDSRTTSRHVMGRHYLELEDPRCAA